MTKRIGIVGYLNADPLTDRLDRAAHEVVEGHPSVIAEHLAKGRVDVALCPVAAVLSDDDYKIVPGWCIGSEGPVTSVLLVSEAPIESWTKVVLDGVSRTSVVLATLLLTKGPLAALVRPDLEIVSGEPGSGVQSATGTVAAVVIGDVARVLPERLSHRIDLAEAWKEWTGLPFVFAVWAARPELDQSVIEAIRKAGEEGTAAIEQDYEGADLHYVRDALRYPLDDRALMGLRRFASMGFRAGLLRREEVDLFPPAQSYRPRRDVDALLDKALSGMRLNRDEALALFENAPLSELALVADARCRQLHPGGDVRFGLRATGVDVAGLVAAGASMLALTGVPTVSSVRAAARRHPGVRLQGGSPGDALDGLGDAGLDEVHDDPVGMLTDATRRKALSAWWLSARDQGVRAVASVKVGQGESAAELVDTLVALREEQDESGVFVAARVWAAFGDGPAGSQANTAIDHLRAVALARLVLDNILSLQAAPDTEGIGMAQASLRMGCDHLGWFAVDDVQRVPTLVADIEHHIRLAGLTPVLEGIDRLPAAAPSSRDATL